MSITTTTVEVTAVLPDDAHPEAATITFALSDVDLEGEVIIPAIVTADLSALGAASVSLWPNALGVNDTYYTVTVTYYRAAPFTAETAVRQRIGRIFVPEAGPADLGDLLADFTNAFNQDWGSVADSATTSLDLGPL